MWPFPPFTVINMSAKRAAFLDLILEQGPPRERAYELCQVYIHRLAWFFRGVDPEEIMDEILPGIYDTKEIHGDSPANPYFTRLNAHDVALFFIILAAGSCAEQSPDSDEEEADKYIQLSRAALALHGIFDRPSLSTVQAITLMGIYYVIFTRRPQMERGWILGQMAYSLSSSVSIDHKF